jgi:Transposase DDE domain
MLTAGNVSDKSVVMTLAKDLFGKLFGDRGYISQDLFQNLYQKGVQLVTKIRKNMKNKLMSVYDKLLLKRRGIVDSVIGQLKERCQIEHTRHRSPINCVLPVGVRDFFF